MRIRNSLLRGVSAAVLASAIGASGLSQQAMAQPALSDCQADAALEGCAAVLEEAQRTAEEEAAAAEAAKQAEEEAAAAEAAKQAEEEAAAAEAAKQAEEEAAAAEAAKQAEEEAAAAEAAKQAEEEAAAAEAAKQAEEEAAAAEAAKQAEEAEPPKEETAGQPADNQAVEETAGESSQDVKTEETVEGAEPGTEQDGETVKAPEPSPEAPKPQPVAEETVEEQIEQAEEVAPAVVSDEITAEQKERLKKAEKKRREEARERRNELIGAAAIGAVVGALVPTLGGTVVEDEGDRFVVERDGRYFVRRDESALFRHNARDVEIERLRNGRTLETVYREDGSQVITLRDAGGYILRREKVTPRGRRVVLFDVREDQPLYRPGFERELPPLRITLPQDEYIAPASRYTRRSLADIFAAPPVQELPSRYTLREVRESEKLRSFVRRVDLDDITFASGSAWVSPSQVEYLADIAGGMLDVIDENPAALFLIEGHTDAVGPDVYNLTLSDRRAETVARILAEAYGVPPENMIVEGYGEQYLKVDTQADERRNRRVTIRNISPLLETAQQ